MLIETTHNDVHTSAKQGKGLLMCTMTHFAIPMARHNDSARSMLAVDFQPHAYAPESPRMPQFQVVLAGSAFFHIKETATGRVRGFRASHNAACALARALESRG
jgi:hypothetical protein